ncbi:hypothetical protein O3P69_008497 [Scylla paramamosain]|uniref:Uncharacterized protein n=1 Tax=Scylla paramamosain TaxID=85552 RepID=A0AAW0SKX0_SCYPA
MSVKEAWGVEGQVKGLRIPSLFIPPYLQHDADDELPDDLQGINKEKGVREMVRFMSLASTGHGLKHTWRQRGTYLGYFWFVITAALIVSLNYAIVLHTIEFASREVQSQSSLDVSPSGLQLPSIVFCNRDFFSKAKLEELNITKRFTSYLMAMAGLPVILRPQVYTTEEGRAFLNGSRHALQALLQKRNETFTQLIDFLSLKCEEFMLQCRFRNFTMGPEDCCKMAVPATTMLGHCYVLYTGSTIKQTLSGENNGLTFLLRDISDQRPEFDASIVDILAMAKTGLQVTLISNITIPMWRVLGEGSIIRPGTVTAIRVFLTQIDRTRLKRILDVDEPSCVTMSYLKNTANSTQRLRSSANCSMMKAYRCISAFCSNCTFPSYRDFEEDGGKNLCDVPTSHNCYNAFKKLTNESRSQDPVLEAARERCTEIYRRNCLPVCEEDTFSSKTRVHDLPPILLHKIRKRMKINVDNNASVVSVYYPSFLHSRLILSRTTIRDYLDDLGGSMGLILGASIITLLESILFVGLSFVAALKKLLRI